MVHLPQEWNFGIPTTLPSPATPLSPLTATPKAIFPLTWRHTFNIPRIKSLRVLSALTALQANIMRIEREYKAGEGVLSYPRLTNWCLAPPLRVKLFTQYTLDGKVCMVIRNCLWSSGYRLNVQVRVRAKNRKFCFKKWRIPLSCLPGLAWAWSEVRQYAMSIVAMWCKCDVMRLSPCS